MTDVPADTERRLRFYQDNVMQASRLADHQMQDWSLGERDINAYRVSVDVVESGGLEIILTHANGQHDSRILLEIDKGVPHLRIDGEKDEAGLLGIHLVNGRAIVRPTRSDVYSREANAQDQRYLIGDAANATIYAA